MLKFKFRALALAGGCFLAGVAFVVACDDEPGGVDAGGRVDAAGTCDTCEPPITSQRVYQVRDTESATVGGLVISTAECKNSQDILLSGGCFLHVQGANSMLDNDDNLHPLLDFGPAPPIGTSPGEPASYYCNYENLENASALVVVATAVCLDNTPD